MLVLRVIISFRDRQTERIFHRERVKGISQELYDRIYLKLAKVDFASSLDDLKVPPGSRLEKLKGDRKGQYSIRVNDQWRVCFEWENGNAFNVEAVDYHS